MSNVMVKSSFFEQMEDDDLAIVTLQNVMNVKSSHFLSETLPQTQKSTPKKIYTKLEKKTIVTSIAFIH